MRVFKNCRKHEKEEEKYDEDSEEDINLDDKNLIKDATVSPQNLTLNRKPSSLTTTTAIAKKTLPKTKKTPKTTTTKPSTSHS